MKKITAVLIGAGPRGSEDIAPYALSHPDLLEFVAVAEPDDGRRERFGKLYGIDNDMCFKTWEELLSKDKLADAAIICTPDTMHFTPCMKALEAGYHILLEKPMSPDPGECIKLGEYCESIDRVFMVAHGLRYNRFFITIKNLLDEGRIGKLISIQHNENIGYWHFAHSYVRGSWGNTKKSSPIILTKCSHDMDMLLWLVGADCRKLSSFGELTHFTYENAPEGAPDRCIEGCPAEEKCPYYAPRIYMTEGQGWPQCCLGSDLSRDGRIDALSKGRYGRCVYRCDNDALDHQSVIMEFENNVNVVFNMCAFTNEVNRTIKLMGTKGEIRGSLKRDEIEIYDFLTGTIDRMYLKSPRFSFEEGDYKLVREFVKAVQLQGKEKPLTSASISVQSHLMALAAEKSRLNDRVIYMNEYIEEIKRNSRV